MFNNNNIIKCYENWHSLEEEQLLCVMETLSAAIVRAKSYGKDKFNWVTERMHVHMQGSKLGQFNH